MESIATKLKILNCPEEKLPLAEKHLISLSMVSTEELLDILSFLIDKELIIPEEEKALVEPENFAIFCNSLEYIQKKVAEFEAIGEIDALKEKIIRLNSKSAPQRISYLQAAAEPYKTSEGKYSKVPFSLRKFTRKYGDVDLNTDLKEQKGITENTQAPVMLTTGASRDSRSATVINPYEEILANPQTIGLNDETFGRYERLADAIKHVMASIYGIDEINDTITDNLIKLVTNEVPDDSIVMYYAITFGKNLSDEEAKKISDTIKEELEYTSILDINLGRLAA